MSAEPEDLPIVGRPQPNDLAAELQVIGSILDTSGRVLDDLDLQPEEFYRAAHGLILEAARALRARGLPVDIVSLVDELRRRGDLNRVGGAPYLHEAWSKTVSSASVAYHARTVRQMHARRVVIETGGSLQQAAADPSTEPEAVVEDARRRLDGLAQRVHGASDWPDMDTALDAWVADLEREDTIVASPWPDLDRLTGGWRAGAMHVVAARPGVGKTIVGVNAALRCAMAGGIAPVFALEMTRSQTFSRAASALTSTPLSVFTKKAQDRTDDDWNAIAVARGRLQERAPGLMVSDLSSLTVQDILSQARNIKRAKGRLDLLVVDYLQLLKSPERAGRWDENREREVAKASRALKVGAKDLDVPLIVMAQLNRQVEMRQGGKPRVSDLRESGALEQDSDVVLLLHKDEEEAPDLVDVIVGKNRHGPTGPVQLVNRAYCARFDSIHGGAA